MPREVRRQASVHAGLDREVPRQPSVQSELDRGPTLMNRKRLRILELTAEGLEKAIVNIEDARSALAERRDKHYRRYRGFGIEESDDDDEEEEEEDSLTAHCNQILQTIMASDHERITQFIKTHTKKSDVSVGERMDLDAAGADFDVLEEYFDTKMIRARMRLTDAQK